MSTDEEAPADLWSSILDSGVSTTRSVPAKQVLILGQPSSGKSTLAHALLKKDISSTNDYALGYDYADVRDDSDEDTLARLSVYTVPSQKEAFTSLLPHFLNPQTCLPHTLVIVVLDWTRPWSFVEQLETWLSWVEQWASRDSSREATIAREEARERLQVHLQHYTEPSNDPIPATSSTISGASTVLPLGPGTFTHNHAGVPIVVVCTKADQIDEASAVASMGGLGHGGMVKGKGGEWEERTDGIMQILRAICLKYGAGLFYTTPSSSSLQILRQYVLHLLFAPPAPSPAMATSASEAPAPIRNPFPFPHRANTLDRDRIVIPAGWDSWGKIVVLRDGFEASRWGEAWEIDMDNGPDEGEEDEEGAKRMYAALIPDQGTKPPPLPPFNSPISEQTFLAKHYDENAKTRDPRGAFRDPQSMPGAAGAASGGALGGVVGPMGSSSFNLPNVERALTEMEASIGGLSSSTAGAGATRGPASRRPAGLAALQQATSPTAGGRGGPSSPLPHSPSPNSAGPGQTQHEVLQNFFQSLLSSKDRGAAGGGGGSKTASLSKASAAAAAAAAAQQSANGGADEG